MEVKIYLTQRVVGDAGDIRFYNLRIYNKGEKVGAGSALLIGMALALYRKGRDKGGTLHDSE
jgi:hypothetical protein